MHTHPHLTKNKECHCQIENLARWQNTCPTCTRAQRPHDVQPGKTTHQTAIMSCSCNQQYTLLHWDTEARESWRKGWVTATASITISFHGGGKASAFVCPASSDGYSNPLISAEITPRAVGDKSRLRTKWLAKDTGPRQNKDLLQLKIQQKWALYLPECKMRRNPTRPLWHTAFHIRDRQNWQGHLGLQCQLWGKLPGLSTPAVPHTLFAYAHQPSHRGHLNGCLQSAY